MLISLKDITVLTGLDIAQTISDFSANKPKISERKNKRKNVWLWFLHLVAYTQHTCVLHGILKCLYPLSISILC